MEKILEKIKKHPIISLSLIGLVVMILLAVFGVIKVGNKQQQQTITQKETTGAKNTTGSKTQIVSDNKTTYYDFVLWFVKNIEDNTVLEALKDKNGKILITPLKWNTDLNIVKFKCKNLTKEEVIKNIKNPKMVQFLKKQWYSEKKILTIIQGKATNETYTIFKKLLVAQCNSNFWNIIKKGIIFYKNPDIKVVQFYKQITPWQIVKDVLPYIPKKYKKIKNQIWLLESLLNYDLGVIELKKDGELWKILQDFVEMKKILDNKKDVPKDIKNKIKKLSYVMLYYLK